MHSKTVKKLIDLFSEFPTVGPRTAARFVFYLMGMKKEEIEELLSAISDLKNNIRICSFCFNPFEGEEELCKVCSDPRRDKTMICVVANETDLMAIEKIAKYKGLYFILGGTLSRLKKEDLGRLRVKELERRLQDHPEIKEIILAMNSTSEGESTALYLERQLKSTCGEPGRTKKISRLGRGLPLGGELEYADEETLGSAFEGRKQSG